jgi:hypothetical protein
VLYDVKPNSGGFNTTSTGIEHIYN